ncbi:hypothetical protein Btru_015854 [Bulinus truncatus]|nr:hypothetical protein Btru_015854 [Bulinus truncatus]
MLPPAPDHKDDMMSSNSQLSQGELAFTIIISFVLIVSVVGNLLVLIVVIKTPKLLNATNVFICNVTVSDILLASLVLPQNIHDISHASENYYEGEEKW